MGEKKKRMRKVIFRSDRRKVMLIAARFSESHKRRYISMHIQGV